MRKIFVAVTALVVATAIPFAVADKESKAEKKRAEIDAQAQETLEELFAANGQAKTLFDEAYGYAVFGNWKFALGISGGGGSGVAVNSQTGERTYMKMGTVGVGFGLGGKKYQVVFLFENADHFNNFVEKGWKAETSATAAAGTASAEAAAGFVKGIALYQLTESGLMAQADVAGTKYWKDGDLNQ
jgi:lipid-binding SYLF domain-containing protein